MLTVLYYWRRNDLKLQNIEINDFNLVEFLENSIEKGKNFLNVPAFLVGRAR